MGGVFPIQIPMRNNGRFRGVAAFTLVELVVVITILAILGTIGFVSYSGYVASSRDTKRSEDLSMLVSAFGAA